MKRLLRYTPLVLCALSSILPMCTIIGFFFGYQFSLYHHEAFLGITAGLSLILTSALFYNKGPINRANCFCCTSFPIGSHKQRLFSFAGLEPDCSISAHSDRLRRGRLSKVRVADCSKMDCRNVDCTSFLASDNRLYHHLCFWKSFP